MPGETSEPAGTEGWIDLRRCKAAAARLFPAGHAFREALLREPDYVPWKDGQAKLDTYLRLLAACCAEEGTAERRDRYSDRGEEE